MKKSIFILAAVLFAGSAWASPPPSNSSYETLRAGGLEVVRLKNSFGRDFLFSNLIYPGQKKQVRVATLLERQDFSKPDYAAKHPGYKMQGEAVFRYVTAAWNDWRASANAYLPKKYKLPELSFVHVDGFDAFDRKRELWDEDTLNIRVDSMVGKYGMASGGNDPARGVGISSFSADGKGYGHIKFFVEQEWMDWMDAGGKSPEELAAAAEEYKKAVCAQMTGDFYETATEGRGYNWEERFSDQTKSYVKALSEMPAQKWDREGPWAAYNQQIITHEMGHLFGLVHMQEEGSIMAASVEGGKGLARPSDGDGLRLATLACWYHNQRAKREVCLPLKEREASKEVKKELKDSMGKLDKVPGMAWQAAGAEAFSAPKTLPALGNPAAPRMPAASGPEQPSLTASNPPVVFAGTLDMPRNMRQAKQRMAGKKSDGKTLGQPVIRTGGVETESVPGGLAAVPAKRAVVSAPAALNAPSAVQKQGAASEQMAVPRAPSEEPSVVTAPAVPPASAQTAVCNVCGKELAEGTYYTDSVGRHIHKRSECAYRYFARFHKTDEESLSRYTDFYFLSVPQDVVQAKSDMKALGLTAADIRRYSAQDAEQNRKTRESFEAQKQTDEASAKEAEKCRFYVRVTLKDIQTFAEDNQQTLQSVRKKERGGRPLSKKEALVKRNYDQLNDNYKLTEYCRGTEARRK